MHGIHRTYQQGISARRAATLAVLFLVLLALALKVNQASAQPPTRVLTVEVVSTTTTQPSFVSPEELARLLAENAWIRTLESNTVVVDGEPVNVDPD